MMSLMLPALKLSSQSHELLARHFHPGQLHIFRCTELQRNISVAVSCTGEVSHDMYESCWDRKRQVSMFQKVQ